MLLPAALAAMTASNVDLFFRFPNQEFPAPGHEATVRYEHIETAVPFSEAVPSWNVEPAAGGLIEVKIRSHGDGFDSKWYTFGTWSLENAQQRTSVKHQADENGDVDTDTFMPKKPAKSVDVEITLRNEGDGPRPRLRMFALSFADTRHVPPSEATSSPAWGKVVEVPQRAQGNYPNGGVLCSPTSLSMVLWHYANQLNRPELNHDVPEVEAHVWDKTYDGAGNWPFNAAYAGSFPGMLAYITRFRSIADLESWINIGLPVICSISLNIARGKPVDGGSGHLVVLVGFTKEGDPVFNDPARRDEVRLTYKRDNFERAWLFSHRTVYLVYPYGSHVPDGAAGAWMPLSAETGAAR